MEKDCIFCKIVKGEIPSIKIYETDAIFGFMDISPLSEGHLMVIPKKHAARAHEVDDKALSEILPAFKKIALAMGVEDYNILQNNGAIAHQAIDHAHWHLIPKPNNKLGLGIIWNTLSNVDQSEIAEKIRENVLNE